ncbi:MAG: hypothetical protein E5V52_02420 [Mesorhizobium sp.]|nr:MAG: hypothetical protein E5V52_02420 [Mesorhizobium sp.]
MSGDASPTATPAQPNQKMRRRYPNRRLAGMFQQQKARWLGASGLCNLRGWAVSRTRTGGPDGPATMAVSFALQRAQAIAAKQSDGASVVLLFNKASGMPTFHFSTSTTANSTPMMKASIFPIWMPRAWKQCARPAR